MNKLDYPARSAGLREVAGVLLKIISKAAVSDQEFDLVANHFYGGADRADLHSFRQLAEVVVEQLPNNPAMQKLVAENQCFLLQPDTANDAWAASFIDAYVEGVGVDTLFSQPVMVGYARRIKGNPYDINADSREGSPGWMLLYGLEGEGIIDTGMRKLRMQPGHLALFEPGAVMSYMRSARSNVWGHYWVTFQAASSWQPWLDWPKVGPQLGYLESHARHQNIKLAFELLLDNYSNGGAMKKELDHTLLELLILRCSQLLPVAVRSPIDPRIKTAQKFIEENFQRSFSVADVASVAAMSSSSLAHLFKHNTGTTVLGWRDEKRMMHAARLLRATAWPISRVAAESGYDDLPFFSRMFKRHLGCTPRQYRNR